MGGGSFPYPLDGPLVTAQGMRISLGCEAALASLTSLTIKKMQGQNYNDVSMLQRNMSGGRIKMGNLVPDNTCVVPKPDL